MRVYLNESTGRTAESCAERANTGAASLPGRLRVRILAFPDGRQSAGSLQSVVVNREFGRHFFHEENAVGKLFRGADHTAYEIAGVCADWRADNPRQAVQPAIYTGFVHSPRTAAVTVTFRISSPPGGRVPASPAKQIRDVVRSIDSNLAITDLRTGPQQVENGLSPERLLAVVIAIFQIEHYWRLNITGSISSNCAAKRQN